MSIETAPSEAVDARRTDTRDRALSVAATLFAEHGYAGTSIRDITEKLGVTKAALYYHFASKEDLLRAIVDEPVGKVREAIAANPDLSTPGLRADFVKAVLVAFASCPPESVAVFKDPELQSVISQDIHASGITNIIAVMLAQALSGTTDPDAIDKAHLLRAVGAVSAGEAMLHAFHVVNPDAGNLTEEALEQIAAVICRTLEP